MRPLLADGSWVELRPVWWDRNLAGGIVAIDAGELVIVHRIVRVEGDWVESRGIARAVSDPPWPASAVIGVVDRISSLGGARRLLRPLAASCAAAMRLRHLARSLA